MRHRIVKQFLCFLMVVSILLNTSSVTALAKFSNLSAEEPHVHNSPGWSCDSEDVLVCGNTDAEHSHSADCYQTKWTCAKNTEAIELTVEYVASAAGQDVPIADTYRAQLGQGEAYCIELPDLSSQGYALDRQNLFCYTQDENGNETKKAVEPEVDENGKYVIRGNIAHTTRYKVGYVPSNGANFYQASPVSLNDMAAYRVNYYGSDAKLLYSFAGNGPKDTEISLSTQIAPLLQTLLDALDNATVTAEGESGEPMIQALVACVDEKYPDSTHDITPLLDRLAEENGCDRGSLTRAQIREHATLALGKTYALDPSHSAENQPTLLLTADGSAEKNFYYLDADSEVAPYQVNYYGTDAQSRETLLYSFAGMGRKDAEVALSTNVKSYMQVLLASLDDAAVAAQGDSGKAMLDALIACVDAKHSSGTHDITPLLESFAAETGCEVNALTREQIREALTKRLEKTYLLDLSRNTKRDAKLVITSGAKAEKNLYYAESIPHVHNEPGWNCVSKKILNCDKTHTHDDSCYASWWTCLEDTEFNQEFVYFTVEYFVNVNHENIRIADTYQALLRKGETHSVIMPDFTKDGYVLDFDHIYSYTKDESGNEVKAEVELTPDANGKYVLEGTLSQTTRYVVNYTYEGPVAPYKVNYYGYDTKGENTVLLYSFVSEGAKDMPVKFSTGVNQMMRALVKALDSDVMRAQPESGEEMIQALLAYMDAQYPDDKHDITPLLEEVAKAEKCTLNTLTREQIKSYFLANLSQIYGLDLSRNTSDDAVLMVTADEKAEKNLYYVVGNKYNVLFTTGLGGASVEGIPQQEFEPLPDADGLAIRYEIVYDTNRITTLPTVDISRYTKNIYAAPDPKKESHKFIGWVTGKGAGVISDYTPENAKGKYKDLTIYTTADKIAELGGTDYQPANGGFALLADQLKTMPEGGVNYYAVWEPHRADYVVQVWFEDANVENRYNLSHTMDIVRSAEIGSKVAHNDFDVERADESKVVAAANAQGGGNFANPIVFADPDSYAEDTYTSYENSYIYSPFYGFDFLECECGDACACAAGGTCSCPVCSKIVLSNPSTTGNKCNCQGVTVGNNGDTVLNVFYTREQWKIIYHPTVELDAYKDYPVISGTLSTQETIVGRFAHHILHDMANEDPALPAQYTFIGKFGMPVSQGHQAGSASAMGTGYTGTNYTQWENIVRDNLAAMGGEVQSGSYTNNYVQKFLGETTDRTGLYFTSEQHNKNYYQAPEGILEPAKLGFAGVAEITPSVFQTYTNGGADLAPDGSTPATVMMQRYTGVWKGDRFSRESSYNLEDGSYTYGTHVMHLYPFYGNVSNTYTIQYYAEALPSETDVVTDTSTGIRYSLLQTDTVDAPCDILSYDAKIPAGFRAQMWRTSISGDFTTTDAKFTGQKVKNVITQANITSKPMTIPPNRLTANPASGNYANYQRNQVMDGKSYYAYLPTWEVWQRSLKFGNIVPDDYWITDWIRVTSNMSATMNDSVLDKDMQQRMESSVRIGWLYPSSSVNRWRYMNTSPSARNGHLYPRSIMDSDAAATTPMSATNVLALTRNRYNITYNTAAIDAEGNLLKDKNGDLIIRPIYTTGDTVNPDGTTKSNAPEILYQQLLDGTGGANNYFNAYFSYDAETGTFEHLGYTDAAGADPVIGGAGKWYLDPDGTIPFNASSMAAMPAKNIDVYYRFSDVHYRVVFIDKLNGGETKTVEFDGAEKVFRDVINLQTVNPNEMAADFPEPTNDDYYFAGWFLDETGSVPFKFTQEITKDTVVYALWKPKVPTKYTVQHVLKMPDGSKKMLDETKTNVAGYVGDTINANALDSGYYIDGMYFESDYYSQSMLLQTDPKKNILTFEYRYAGRYYTIRYREKDNEDRIVAPDVNVPTKLSYVTAKYRDFEDWGWKLASAPYETRILEDGKTAVITFLYERLPGPTLQLKAQKFLNGEPLQGTRFSFKLSGADDGYGETVQAVDGQIEFQELWFGAVGEYRYILMEMNEAESGVTYDESVYQILVRITEDDKTNLVMEEPIITLNGKPYTGEIEFHNLQETEADDPGSNGEGKGELPGTGDGTPTTAILAALIVSSAVGAILLGYRNKQKNTGKL